jgi:hypothetical protein
MRGTGVRILTPRVKKMTRRDKKSKKRQSPEGGLQRTLPKKGGELRADLGTFK